MILKFKNKIKTIDITYILNIIFILYAATFIIDSGLHRTCIYLSTIIWIIEGNFKEKFNQIFKQKIILFYFGIIILFLVSLTFFSSSISDGFWDSKYSNGYQYIFNKNITYFLMAVYISTSLKKKLINVILIAFVLQALYISIYSYAIYFGLLDGNPKDPVHFTHHIFFSIIMTLAFFTSIYLYRNITKNYLKISLVLVSSIFLINLFIIGGRLGQISFLITIVFVFYYYLIVYKKESLKKMFVPIVSVLIFLILAFNISANFKERINLGISDINKVIDDKNFSTSWGTRIGFDIVNIELLLSNPRNFLLGYGMGNSKKIMENYIQKNDKKKLHILQYNHVHNQFFQIWIDGGILALILYISLYITLLKLNTGLNEKLLIMSFVSIFSIVSMGEIIYHRGTILGLFALFIGLFLAANKYMVRDIQQE